MAKSSKGLKGTKGLAVGIDLGDRVSVVVVKDGEGEVCEEVRLATTSGAFRSYFERLPASQVLLEASGHSPWVQRLLRGLGHEAVVANPHQLRLIAESVGKSDREDASVLADLARLGFGSLGTVEHRSDEAQAHIEVLRARAILVRQRSALALHIRGVVKSNGGRVSGGVRAPSGQVLEQVPTALRGPVQVVQEQIAGLTVRIKELEGQIETLIREEYPVARHLQQVRGVGPITALTFVLVIGRAERFEKSRQVGAYVGLTGKRRQSGDHDPELGITKAGDRELRRLLVQCAHHILSHPKADSDLRRWGLAKAAGGKNTYKRAVVAVARKLAVLLHVLWVRGEVYEPFRVREGAVMAAVA